MILVTSAWLKSFQIISSVDDALFEGQTQKLVPTHAVDMIPGMFYYNHKEIWTTREEAEEAAQTTMDKALT